ncbi:MAG: hypothetical protein FWG54_04130 [Bacteroidetes bacterium]|nr:hypothetical protein [Bacteroidota bacterium]
MNKYSFVLHHASSPTFLEQIQELGLVDVSRKQKAMDETSKEMHAQLLRYKNALKFLTSVKPVAATPAQPADPSELPFVESPDVIDLQAALGAIETAIARKEQIAQQKQSVRKEMAAAAPWGSFGRGEKERLHALGFTLHAYSCAQKRFRSDWEEQYPLFEINRIDGTIYFVALQEQGEPFDFPLSEVKFPEHDLSALETEMNALEREAAEIDRNMSDRRPFIDPLKNHIAWIQSEFERYLAGKSVQKEAEETIDIFTGFAPRSDSDRIGMFLEETSVLYVEEEAKEEDLPPVKLKNNWFARLYEPIGELYMLPKYGELDLTPYFAPFYMLFFGLCLGDMGYGLVLILAGFAVKKFIPSLKGYANLVQLLGVGAILMASLLGGVFGVSLSEASFVPEKLRSAFFSSNQLFWFAILFGIFQILFARILSAVDTIIRKGWQHGMSNIGWAILIAWLSVAYASGEVKGINIPKIISLIWLGISLSMILFFTKTKGNIFTRLFSGITALYDITGVFGDILSYIRLFGLAMSGGILGLIVNSVASGMSGIPYVGWFLAILMLLVGHTLVLLLSCLGAFVHPMRLTFVEFYKNVGFGGGGRPFKPLRKETTNAN